MEELKLYFSELYNHNEFLQGGFILGIITTIGYYLKGLLPKVWERIERYGKFQITVDQHEAKRLYFFIEKWLSENYAGHYRNLKVKLYNKNQYAPGLDDENIINKLSNHISSQDNKEKMDTKLSYEQINDFFYIRYKRRYIRVSQNREQLQNANSLSTMYIETYNFSSWFGKKKIQKLLDEIVVWGEDQEEAKKKKLTASVYKGGKYGDLDYVHDVEIKSLDNIIIEGKDDLIQDFEDFLTSHKWYKERSIPYKRGYLFSGLPGNGKTTLALSLAQSYNKNVIVSNLSNMTNEGLETLFVHELNQENLLLLEDIDAMSTDRSDGETYEEGVDLSTLLNCLDGAFSKEGAVVIMTTNYPERLDSALIRRGRIDYKFTVSHPSLKAISEYMSLFYNREIEFAKIHTDKYNKCLSMVDIQGICIENKNSSKNAVKEIMRQIELNKNLSNPVQNEPIRQ